MDEATEDTRTSVEANGAPAAPPREAFDKAVVRASAGRDLSAAEEQSALDWLLGTPPPNRYDVVVRLETPSGQRDLTFGIKQVDARQIDKTEMQYRNELTGQLDVIGAAAGVVGLATEYIDDGTRKLDPRSEDFRRVPDPDDPSATVVIASPAEALIQRFRWQLGLLQGVAREVRRVAGVEADRVGKASRRLVVASGN